ncbi:MAG: prpR [Rhodospirillales bacterium]|nr:prpR [Rhodospirillales bacterium]
MNEPMLSALELLRTRSLASLATQEIERLILNGELQAGERLNELALAARLGVSRGPVREAMRALEGGGLVVTVVNQGSFVRKVSAEEAHELYEVRVVLTGHACAQLARSATDAQIAELRGLTLQMAEAERQGDAGGYYALNLAFHAALMRCAGNKRALRIYEDLGNELNLFRRRSLVSAKGMQASNAEHEAIVRAIAAGDPVAARQAGEVHIARGMARFVASSPPTETAATGAGPPSTGTKIAAEKAPRRRKAAS